MVAVELSKVVVVVINLIFMIFGLAILICGIVFKVNWDEVRDAFVDKSAEVDFNLQEAGDTLGTACIVFGAFILILSLMGCIGGCCRIRFLLALYAIVVLLILLSQVAVVAVVAVNADNAEDNIVKALRDSLNNYTEASTDDTSKAWSAVFSTVECCGVVNYTLEFNTTNIRLSNFRSKAQTDKRPIIPVTCCKNLNYEDTLTQNVFNDENIKKCIMDQTTEFAYVKGCETKISDLIDENKGYILGVGITIFIIEIIVIILGFFLCCRHED